MTYVDRQLAPGEEVVFRTRPHPVVFAGTLGFAACVLGAVALIVARNDLAGRTVAFLWLAGAVVVLGSFVGPLRRWQTAEFAVTTRRLLVTFGMLAVRTFELPLGGVETIDVNRPLGGRLLGYGTVRIAGEGVAESFARVAQPEDFRAAVLRHVPRSARAGRR